MNRRARDQFNQRDYDFIDTNLAINFDTGSIGHKLLTGLNGGQEVSDFTRNKFFLLANTVPTDGAFGSLPCTATFTTLNRQQCSLEINLDNPVYSDIPLSAFPAATPGLSAHRYTKQTNYAGYASDLLTLSEKWKAMVGVRYEHSTTDTDELNVTTPVPTRTSTFDDVLPLAGLLFQPNDHWSIYTSYSSSFAPPPAAAIGIDGNAVSDPETAEQVEAGVKADFLDGRLSTTIAGFIIKKSDVVTVISQGTTVGGETCGVAPNPVQATCSVLVGEEQAQGGELEIDAQLTDNWHLTGGYAYTDTEVTNTVSALDFLLGSRLLASPLNSAHLWTRYDINSGPLTGLGFGLGLVYSSSRLATLPTGPAPGVTPGPGQVTDTNDVLVLPSFTYADLGIYYVRESFDVTLKVSNLGDKLFYESAGSQGTIQIVPGVPRNVALSFRMNF
jgi:iron complex outermembrane receptor protein